MSAFRKLCAVVAIFMMSAVAGAQDAKIVVIEPYLGLTLPVRHVDGTNPFTGLDFGAEARYNLECGKLSLGFDYNWTVAARKQGDKHNSLRMVSYSAICDYYLHRGKTVAFFVGTGAGVAYRNSILSDVAAGIGVCNDYGFVASPRAGFELWDHVRLTFESRITQKYYNTVGFRLGVPIGIARRK